MGIPERSRDRRHPPPAPSRAHRPRHPPTLTTFVAREDADHLERLADLVATGHVTPVVDRTYPLTEAADAIAHLESGRTRGKIAIDIDQPETAMNASNRHCTTTPNGVLQLPRANSRLDGPGPIHLTLFQELDGGVRP